MLKHKSCVNGLFVCMVIQTIHNGKQARWYSLTSFWLRSAWINQGRAWFRPGTINLHGYLRGHRYRNMYVNEVSANQVIDIKFIVTGNTETFVFYFYWRNYEYDNYCRVPSYVLFKGIGKPKAIYSSTKVLSHSAHLSTNGILARFLMGLLGTARKLMPVDITYADVSLYPVKHLITCMGSPVHHWLHRPIRHIYDSICV